MSQTTKRVPYDAIVSECETCRKKDRENDAESYHTLPPPVHKSKVGVIALATTPTPENGGYLLSHFYAVPSAQLGLTSLFGMGRGGTPTL